MTLRPGLLALLDRPILEPRWLDGLARYPGNTRGGRRRPRSGRAGALPQGPRIGVARRGRLRLHAARALLDRLLQAAEQVAGDLGNEGATQAGWWAEALARQCRAIRDELIFLAPWTGLERRARRRSKTSMKSMSSRRCAALADSMLALSAPPRGPARAPPTPAQAGVAGGAAPPHRSKRSERAQARIAAIQDLALEAEEFARVGLWFPVRQDSRLLSIGYNVDERRHDASYYDLLASEARLSVFVAIAQGQLAAGKLVRTGTPAYQRWRRTHPAVVERLDVRVPDAATGDADL